MIGGMVRDTAAVAKESGGSGPVKDVGESDDLSDEQKPVAAKFDAFIEAVNGPSLGSAPGAPKAYHATTAKFNGHALVTSARAELICKVYLKGNYAEIIRYSEGTLDTAKEYYAKVTAEGKGAHAFNGQTVIYIPETKDDSEAIIKQFSDADM